MVLVACDCACTVRSLSFVNAPVAGSKTTENNGTTPNNDSFFFPICTPNQDGVIAPLSHSIFTPSIHVSVMILMEDVNNHGMPR